jgi:hypothetical protein
MPANDDNTNPIGHEGGSIRRLHSGSEDGYLWYVVGADGESVYSGIGHVDESGARAELEIIESGADHWQDDCECDCGAVGASGGYVRHAAGAKGCEAREAQAIEDVALSDFLGLATGDRSATIREARAVVDWVREFALDCDWQDADSETIEAMPALDLLRACHRHLDGGLATALDAVRQAQA